MLYHLFSYLDTHINLPGIGVFRFISFRAGMAMIFSLLIALVFGELFINYLRSKQIKETVRTLGLTGEEKKQGTPTMGGLIILSAIIIPTLLLAQLQNIYILLMLLVTVGLGAIGFIDDYIKVFRNNKAGLAAKTKLIGQCVIGCIVGATMYFHPDIRVREDITHTPEIAMKNEVGRKVIQVDDGKRLIMDYKAPVTTIPFIKNSELNYDRLLGYVNSGWSAYGFLFYIPFITLIIMFISNGANLTDGMDGLATGISAIIGITIGLFTYLSGNYITAEYLNILYLPDTGELAVFVAAFIGACIGFLFYNAFPASVFMGDTGSLAIGGIIASLAIIIRKELLLPVICGVFIIENLSVMMQVSYFKYTKNKFGEGRRIFLMSPLHHHFHKKGMHEAKIVVRFWIVGILLAVLTFLTLKLR